MDNGNKKDGNELKGMMEIEMNQTKSHVKKIHDNQSN